jgi:hypothetical protein
MRTASWDTWDKMQAWPRKYNCGVETDKQPNQLVFPGIHYAKASGWPKINRKKREPNKLYLQVKLFAKRIQYKPALWSDLSIERICGPCFGENAAIAAVASEALIRMAKRVSGRTQYVDKIACPMLPSPRNRFRFTFENPASNSRFAWISAKSSLSAQTISVSPGAVSSNIGARIK